MFYGFPTHEDIARVTRVHPSTSRFIHRDNMLVWTHSRHSASRLDLVLLVLVFSCPALGQTRDKFTFDLTVPYFTDVSMVCDHPTLNVTQLGSIHSITWMLPDGSLVNKDSRLNPLNFFFSDPTDRDAAVAPTGPFAAYNLTAVSVDESVFGYYTCVVVYDKSNSTQVAVIRWGLNVDGADFSELIETFKENAIIGGVAAAAMLLLVGGSCLLWHFRFSNRHNNDEKFEDFDGVIVAEPHHVTQEKINMSYTEDGEPSHKKSNSEDGKVEDEVRL